MQKSTIPVVSAYYSSPFHQKLNIYFGIQPRFWHVQTAWYIFAWLFVCSLRGRSCSQRLTHGVNHQTS